MDLVRCPVCIGTEKLKRSAVYVVVSLLIIKDKISSFQFIGEFLARVAVKSIVAERLDTTCFRDCVKTRNGKET